MFCEWWQSSTLRLSVSIGFPEFFSIFWPIFDSPTPPVEENSREEGTSSSPIQKNPPPLTFQRWNYFFQIFLSIFLIFNVGFVPPMVGGKKFHHPFRTPHLTFSIKKKSMCPKFFQISHNFWRMSGPLSLPGGSMRSGDEISSLIHWNSKTIDPSSIECFNCTNSNDLR